MPTEYPVLDNRPINKWKVTELREELKKRNLTVKGLKDELVKRLDEAIRKEREALEMEESKGSDSESEPVLESSDAQVDHDVDQVVDDASKGSVNEVSETDDTVAKSETNDCPTDKVDHDGDQVVDDARNGSVNEVSEADDTVAKSETNDCPTDKVDHDGDQVVDDARKGSVNEVSEADDTVAKSETNDCPTDTEHAKSTGEVPTGDSDQSTMVEGRKDSVMPMETVTSVDVNEGPVEMVLDNKVDVSIEGSSLLESSLDGGGIVKEVVEMKIISAEEPNSMGEENGIEVPPNASGGITTSSKVDPENEGLKPLKMDAEPDLSHPSTQVHEVIPNLGSQVKSDSIPSDSLPIYVTKELNDDLNADNVQLEQEIVRPEMVPPSANKDPSGFGINHPMDDQMPSKSQGLVGGTDDDESSNVKFSMKNENADQSFVDVSIIEHNMDNKASNSTELEVLSKDGNMNQAEFSCKEKESSEEEKLDVAASTEETKFQDNESTDAGFSKITEMADGENLEKINLDQSSADDSMEEDIVEIKIVDSEQISSEVGEKAEEPHTKEPGLGLEGSSTALPSDIPSDAVEVSHGDKNKILDAPEKRKFQEAAASGSKEPAKRQRKWNYESLKISEPKSPSISVLTPKQISRPSPGGDDSMHDVDTPKERIVPESSKTPTNSLRIDNFVRPFTLKAVQELLGRTGKICNFWMDHIKTHCFVKFSSVEEAIETRNAVYNLQWPTNGGRLLLADFVDPQEVISRLEGPSKPTTPTASASPAVPPVQSPLPSPLARQQAPPREQGERPHPLSRQPPPPASDRPAMKERLARPPSPVAEKTEEAPILTLDDLFRKTRATPRIYYLPLTDEQVSRKVNEQQRNK
ncbi:PREDICTED: altered inheritance of mitochondria protein 21-like isoform X2 [Ipomoea nil]|uniref:altered inheritance of mitochondria protein 21-like isoform X2 n=1 Tax=Ipomoea nil TaxID=35883 RepID=UPI000900DEEE|nr:PREDICTED: altered inheritance of mitochondria protein 21-like isoform X2 [Ipomoea nil]